MKKKTGFTMVEMMAVIAVIAILALMTLPSYFDKIVRAQIESALPLADIAKKPIAEAWKLLQDFPENNEAILLPKPDKIVSNHVTRLSVTNGAIDMTFGNHANRALVGKILTLRPAVVSDEPAVPVAWVCGYAETPAKMSVMGKNNTNIPQELLPLECRNIVRNAG